jgi:methylated-DNA-[protein]-cysteine S-methyltransferase
VSGKLKYATVNIGKGWVGMLASANGLMATTLPQSSAGEAKQQLGIGVNQAVFSLEPFADLAERLRLYFTGGKVNFPDELDLSGATPFQRRVWEKTRLIPYGETRSYLWVAGQVGNPKAARAVGQALSKNPLSIIVPCHRVIASDGGLGGFGGGAEMKRYLLRLENPDGIR